ncbi:MAG TPA: HEAT repeat domain-containing protein, partial [Anaerolineae bacterium]|nr:HEAT repeat domain-containing protein [Anaerolineae bacterium]
VLLGETRKLPPQSFRQLCQVLSLIHQNPLENLEVRRRALESLAYAGVAELPTLIQAAYRHPAEAMQISAVFAMGRSADLRWREMVMRQLHHPSPAMRYEAARACGELATRDAVPELVELADDVDLEVQEAALWALGQIGGDLARLTLERYLEAESETLRFAADEALQELEFMHGSLDTFFGPPEDLITESDLPWDFRSQQPTAEDFAGDEDEGDEGDEDEFEDADEFEDEDDFDDEYGDEDEYEDEDAL